MGSFVMAIDQGTTSTRSIIFDGNMRVAGVGQEEFAQHYPASGWVEHDPEDIWNSTVATMRRAMAAAGIAASDLSAIGIANQRETVVIWDPQDGRPIHNAIVWQDRRTAAACEQLRAGGLEPLFAKRTGLLLDPYFSGTKLAWLLDHVDGAREKAEAGRLLAGTIDSFLIWRLTGGRVHATDATNAARSLIYDIGKNAWDEELADILGIPLVIMPEVRDCADDFGVTSTSLFGAAIPIRGVAGDQQAATIGQACFAPGMMKSTYGTGCFAVLNTGSKLVRSKNRLLSTIAYRLAGETTYALEGSIFIAGAAVQWLRDGLRIINSAAETGRLAEKADEAQAVYLVPAFVGLGAPYWNSEARGAMFGLARNTGPAELARAALESVAYQTHDLVSAMRKDWGDGETEQVLRVDGGMVASDWTMQCIADILAAPVDRPTVLETTALGAAWLAGSHVGVWPDAQAFSQRWVLQRRFVPQMDADVREKKLAGWHEAVRRTIG
jgi:glycerol kinase